MTPVRSGRFKQGVVGQGEYSPLSDRALSLRMANQQLYCDINEHSPPKTLLGIDLARATLESSPRFDCSVGETGGGLMAGVEGASQEEPH